MKHQTTPVSTVALFPPKSEIMNLQLELGAMMRLSLVEVSCLFRFSFLQGVAQLQTTNSGRARDSGEYSSNSFSHS